MLHFTLWTILVYINLLWCKVLDLVWILWTENLCYLKVLLPLINVPMINYTLAWLESAGVEEVFVFCCAHSKQVIDYLENSEWFSQPNFSVTTIESHNSVSAGDALRVIYERNVVSLDLYLSYLSFFLIRTTMLIQIL